MKSIIRISALLLSAISIMSCTGIPAVESVSFSDEDIAVIEAELDTLTADGNLPGLVMWIDSPEYRFEGASGLSDIPNEIDMPADGVFKIGSITKMFTAATVLRLFEDGLLNLDDTVAQWLPDVAGQLPHGNEITVRQLLSHTSGLFNVVEHELYYVDIFSAIAVDPATGFVSLACEPRDPNATLERYVYGKDAYFAPGSAFRYSNTNYILLGMIIETVTNSTVTEVYESYIYQPLGLTSTYLDCYEAPIADPVRGYTGFGAEQTDLTGLHESVGWTAGGMVSTAADLIRFGRGLFGRRLFKDPATLALMTSPAENSENGLGVFLLGDHMSHSGGIAGFRSVISYYPENDMVAVMLYNHDSVDPEVGLGNVLNVVQPIMTGK